jgi:hypothetical protein
LEWLLPPTVAAAAEEDVSRVMDRFEPNTRVEVNGLTARPDLNGKSATVVKYVADRGRYHVKVDKGAEETYLRPANVSTKKVARLRKQAERMATAATALTEAEHAMHEALRGGGGAEAGEGVGGVTAAAAEDVLESGGPLRLAAVGTGGYRFRRFPGYSTSNGRRQFLSNRLSNRHIVPWCAKSDRLFTRVFRFEVR